MFWQKLKKPIIGLSPMDGVTDEPMRQIQVSVAKPDVLYTEFVSVEGFVRKREVFEKTLFFKENERPIVAQIFGYTPEAFYESILQIRKLEFDGIDLNMGCPAKNVLGKGGGGGLIGNFSLVEKIINKSSEAIKKSGKDIALSIKTRISKKEIITKEWFTFLSQFPIEEVTIHGRLLSQGHRGEVFWEEIQKAAEILHSKNIICLGNGGIKNLTEAKEKSEKFNLDGVLIGQAALGNPWLFKDNYHPAKKEILKTIVNHAKKAEEFYPKNRFVTVLKHFGWYSKGFENCVKLKVELLQTRNLSEVKKVISHYKDN